MRQSGAAGSGPGNKVAQKGRVLGTRSRGMARGGSGGAGRTSPGDKVTRGCAGRSGPGNRVTRAGRALEAGWRGEIGPRRQGDAGRSGP